MSFLIIPIGIILVGMLMIISVINSIVKFGDVADLLMIGLGVLVIRIGVLFFRSPVNKNSSIEIESP